MGFTGEHEEEDLLCKHINNCLCCTIRNHTSLLGTLS